MTSTTGLLAKVASRLFVVAAVFVVASLVVSNILLASFWSGSNFEPLSFRSSNNAGMDWKLFTQTSVRPSSGSVEQSSKPRAIQANMQLVAIAGGEGRKVALVGVDRQPLKAFIEGDVLADGWEIVSIRSDGLILRSGPDERYLGLKKLSSDERSPIQSRRSNDSVSQLESLGAKIVRSRSGQQGIAVSEVDEVILSELGLEAGDVLIKISDFGAVEIVSNPSEYQTLLSRSSWKVEVFRRGRQVEIEVPVSAVLNVVSKLEDI